MPVNLIYTIAGSTDPFLNGATTYTYSSNAFNSIISWSMTNLNSLIQAQFNSSGSSSFVPTDVHAAWAIFRNHSDGLVSATNKHIVDGNVASAIIGSTSISYTSS